MIDVRDPNKLINRLEIFKALIATTKNPKIAEQIDYISQFEKRNLWFITFKRTYDIKSLLNEKLKLNNEDYIIQDTLDTYTYCTYKIAWLPHNTTLMQITSFFKDVSQLIEIIDWKEERCDYKEIANVKSGIHIVKARFLRENKDKVKLKSGIYDFYFGFHNCVVKYSCKIFLTVSIDSRVDTEQIRSVADDRVSVTCPEKTPERSLHTVKEDSEHCSISTPLCSFRQTLVETTKIQQKSLNLFQFNEKNVHHQKSTGFRGSQNSAANIWKN